MFMDATTRRGMKLPEDFERALVGKG